MEQRDRRAPLAVGVRLAHLGDQRVRAAAGALAQFSRGGSAPSGASLSSAASARRIDRRPRGARRPRSFRRAARRRTKATRRRSRWSRRARPRPSRRGAARRAARRPRAVAAAATSSAGEGGRAPSAGVAQRERDAAAAGRARLHDLELLARERVVAPQRARAVDVAARDRRARGHARASRGGAPASRVGIHPNAWRALRASSPSSAPAQYVEKTCSPAAIARRAVSVTAAAAPSAAAGRARGAGVRGLVEERVEVVEARVVVVHETDERHDRVAHAGQVVRPRHHERAREAERGPAVRREPRERAARVERGELVAPAAEQVRARRAPTCVPASSRAASSSGQSVGTTARSAARGTAARYAAQRDAAPSASSSSTRAAMAVPASTPGASGARARSRAATPARRSPRCTARAARTMRSPGAIARRATRPQPMGVSSIATAASSPPCCRNHSGSVRIASTRVLANGHEEIGRRQRAGRREQPQQPRRGRHVRDQFQPRLSLTLMKRLPRNVHDDVTGRQYMPKSRLLVALALGACARAQHASVSDLRAYLSATYPSASGSIARANDGAAAVRGLFLGAPAAPAAGCVCGAALGTLSRSVHRDLTARAAAASGAASVSPLARARRRRQRGRRARRPPRRRRRPRVGAPRRARVNGSHVEVTHFRGDGHRHKGGDFLDGGPRPRGARGRGSGVSRRGRRRRVREQEPGARRPARRAARAPLEAHWFDLLFKRDRAAPPTAARATLARDPSARRACADVGLRCREGYVLADEYDEMMLRRAARALGYDTLVLAASPMRSVEHGLVFEARERRRRRRRGGARAR